MDELRVYIANLGKYNEGELVGEWFTLPVDEEKVAEQIGLNEIYEEYAIHDYELPFEIDEYISLEELNRLGTLAQELEGMPFEDSIQEIQQAFFNSFEEMVEHKDDIVCYSDCETMADVAASLIEEGVLGEIPANLVNYIDYEAFGRDLEIEGNFLVTRNGIFECKN
ncbi:antirestriction protein ArdA [Enterococcus faecalis]|uniref:antirestriction protein ArdA n=1 Tax=Enterococcus faecalis TaxID=1351 RepID=UPI0020910D20|nr:antirestriction protein ArdA [Enterococcus faecalis]MCO5432990.1 antirestriction protein ArdA [Enterococcus faecalis]